MVKPAAAPAPAPKPGAANIAPLKPGASPAPGDKPRPPKRKSGKLLWVFLALAILACIGAAAWHFMWRGDAVSQADEGKSRPPVFLTLEPFTVNLAEESGDHYLQAGIVYQLRDDKVAEAMKAYMPVVRDRILLLLSAKRPSDIATVEGKRKLIDELVNAARDSLPAGPPTKGINGALFSAFVIQ